MWGKFKTIDVAESLVYNEFLTTEKKEDIDFDSIPKEVKQIYSNQLRGKSANKIAKRKSICDFIDIKPDLQ